MTHPPCLRLLLAGLIVATSAGFSDAPDCQTWQCGSNSPELYGHRLAGLSTVGSPNHRGVRIVPRSLVAPHCGREPLDLRVVDGAFIGVDPAGRRRCVGTQLRDATFEIDEGGAHLRVLIEESDQVSTWEIDDNRRRLVPTYRLAFAPTPDQPRGQAICRLSPWMEPWQLANLPGAPSGGTPGGGTPGGGITRAPTAPTWVVPPGATRTARIGGQPWGRKTVHAVIVQGEGYDEVSAEIAETGTEWFSVGCAGRAVAKMRLMGLDPMCSGDPAQPCVAPTRTSSPAQRQATLKMITARYHGVQAHTEQGVALLWVSAEGIQYFGDPRTNDPRLGPVEALWNADGVACLSHFRLSNQSAAGPVGYRSSSERGGPRDVSGYLDTAEWSVIRENALTVCPALSVASAKQMMMSTFKHAFWATFTYNHAAHPRGLGPCPPDCK